MSIPALKWAGDILIAHDLTQTQRLALLCLAYHHHNTTGSCFPTMQTVADYAGVSERRARMNIRDLEALGLIKSRKRVTSQGQSSNQYELFGSFKRADKKSRARGDASVRATGGTLASGDKEGIYTGEKTSSRMRVISGGRNA